MSALPATRTSRFRLARLPARAVHCSMLALTLLAACADGTRSAPTAPGALHAARAAARGAAPMRPIQGRCESVLSPFPDPLTPQFTQRVTGTCQLSHLGRVTYDFTHTVDLTASPVSFTTTDLVFTAPNGDVLQAPGTVVGIPNATGLAVSGTYVITGGTGRFSGARGYLHMTGQAALPEFTVELTLDGEIAYDASDRSRR